MNRALTGLDWKACDLLPKSDFVAIAVNTHGRIV